MSPLVGEIQRGWGTLNYLSPPKLGVGGLKSDLCIHRRFFEGNGNSRETI